MITKTDMLFVRACKSLDPPKRIRSVYRRFYSGDSQPDKHLVVILSRICDEYVPFKTADLINGLSPAKDWMYEDCCDFYSRTIAIVTGQIRHAEIEKFPGFVSPACFRNK